MLAWIIFLLPFLLSSFLYIFFGTLPVYIINFICVFLFFLCLIKSDKAEGYDGFGIFAAIFALFINIILLLLFILSVAIFN